MSRPDQPGWLAGHPSQRSLFAIDQVREFDHPVLAFENPCAGIARLVLAPVPVAAATRIDWSCTPHVRCLAVDSRGERLAAPVLPFTEDVATLLDRTIERLAASESPCADERAGTREAPGLRG